MFKLNKWQFVCRFAADPVSLRHGWRQLQLGVFKLHRLPDDGEMICRNDYRGFYLRISFFMPMLIERFPVRKIPNKQKPRTLIWAGNYRYAKEFIAEHRIEDAKIITSAEQLRGYRGATLIDLGNHPEDDATERMRLGIEDSLICDRLDLFTEQEYLDRKARVNK